MSKTKALKTSVKSLAGVAGAAIAAIVVIALCFIPLPSITAKAASVLVDPTPAEQVRVCPGSFVDVKTQGTDATSFVGFGQADVVTMEANTTVSTSQMDAVDNVSTDPLVDPTRVAGAATADVNDPALVSVAQSQSAVTDNIAGLATSQCGYAQGEAWFVGGATDTGRTTLLMLSNPTEVTSTVTLEIFAESGPVEVPASQGILVEPGTQKLVSLASFGPGLIAPVVHITSTGGQIVASMQQSVTRSLVPGGVETIVPGMAPNTHQVITGVRLSGMAAFSDAEGGLVSSDKEPTIRLMLTGEGKHDVSVTLIPQKGKNTVIKTKATAGTTLQLPFGNVADGIYTVLIDSTQPLVAGVRTIQATTDAVPVDEKVVVAGGAPAVAPVITPAPATATATPTPTPTATVAPQSLKVEPTDGFDGPISTDPSAVPTAPSGGAAVSTQIQPDGDFAWYPTMSKLADKTLIPIPAGPHATLTLYNPYSKELTISIAPLDGSATEVTVPQKGFASVTLGAPGRYVLKGAVNLFGAVSFADAGIGSAMVLAPSAAQGASIQVYPR